MRDLGTLAAPVVSALPGGGSTGQLVSYNGLLYQFTGSTWTLASSMARLGVTVGTTADCDYVVSNYASANAAVQAAIDGLPTTGGTVIIKRGTYDFINDVFLAGTNTDHTGVTVRGEGIGATLVNWPNGVSLAGGLGAHHMFALNGANCRLMDISLLGHANYTAPLYGIGQYTATGTNTIRGGGARVEAANCTVENVYAYSIPESCFLVRSGGINAKFRNISAIGSNTGFNMNTGDQYEINGLFVQYCANGLTLSGSVEGGYISDFQLLNIVSTAVNISTGSNLAMTNGTISNCGGSAVVVSSGATYCKFSNIAITRTGLAASTGSTISNGGSYTTWSNIVIRDAHATAVSTTGNNNVYQGVVVKDTYALSATGAVVTTTVSTTASSTTITSVGLFTQAHVNKSILIPGAGVAGAALTTTIATYVDANTVTLTVAPSTTVANAAATVHATTTGFSELVPVWTTYANCEVYAGDVLTNQIALQNGSQFVNGMGVNPRATVVIPSQSSATASPDLRNGDVYDVTLSFASSAFTIFGPSSAPPRGSRMTLVIHQDVTGGRLATWTNLTLIGGALTLSTSPFAVDIITIMHDGNVWREVSRQLGDATTTTASADETMYWMGG